MRSGHSSGCTVSKRPKPFEPTEQEERLIHHVRDIAHRTANEVMIAGLSPTSSLAGKISPEAIQMAFLKAIDEFITGIMMTAENKKEAFALLYQMIDAIPAWVETKDGKPPGTSTLFGD